MNVTPFRQKSDVVSRNPKGLLTKIILGGLSFVRKRGGKSGGLGPDTAQPKTTTPVIL